MNRVADGVFKRGPVFYVRPWVKGKRTWRKLKAITLKFAIEEARAKKTDQSRSKVGTAIDPFSGVSAFLAMADLYVAAQCPDSRLQPRHAALREIEAQRLEHLRTFFGKMRLHEIKLPALPRYKEWRVKKCQKGSGERTVDMELVTLSNVLNYAVSIGCLDFNYIGQNRPRFRQRKDVRKSRDVAPPNADVIHEIAATFFVRTQSEVLGWNLLFSILTGCRKTELLSLRMDAKTKDDPGYIEGNYLFIRRAKGGVNNFILIEGAFKEMIEAFKRWHQGRFPKNPWYFPGRMKDGKEPMDNHSLNVGLRRACKGLNIPVFTPHGCRSFYVTKRRSDGLSDAQVAAEIGDKTVAIISETYGAIPPNWQGSNKLTFLPKEGKPAWSKY